MPSLGYESLTLRKWQKYGKIEKISKLKLMRYHMVGPRPTKLGVNISHIVRHLYLEFENSSFCGSWSTLSPLERGIFRVWSLVRGKKLVNSCLLTCRRQTLVNSCLLIMRFLL